MTKLLPILIAVASLGCESSPKPKDVPKTTAAVPAAVRVDGAALVQQAELLRDREFSSPVRVERDDDFQDTSIDGCSALCDADRDTLTKVLFGGTPPVRIAPLARFDGSRRVVEWDGKSKDAVGLRAAVLAELVSALDAQGASRVPAPQSWDSYLAHTALSRGPGVFVATLHEARQVSRRVDASRLALRPEGLYRIETGASRFADTFETREGFAFVAALIRSGGWSAVELALIERPSSSHEIVRPDRYLGGEQPGTWTWPEELVNTRAKAGFVLQRTGRVGPALFVEWLSHHVPTSAARAGYIGFESDTYRVFEQEDGRWVFDWVSLWNAPSVAEQIVEALDAGLRERSDGARFTVLRKGATVAVLGESSPRGDPMTLATLLAEMLPTFNASRPRGVEFVPTPVDRIQRRPHVSSMPSARWQDSATGLSLDLGALDATWNVLPTTEPNLPWFGKHASGAVIQFIVEPVPLLDPPFTDEAYAKLVQQRFSKTIHGVEPVSVRRADEPVPSSLIVDAVGKIKDRGAEGPVKLRAWHFENGPFVMTLSLQAPVDRFDELVGAIRRLMTSINVVQRRPTPSGVIKFSVDEEP